MNGYLVEAQDAAKETELEIVAEVDWIYLPYHIWSTVFDS